MKRMSFIMLLLLFVVPLAATVQPIVDGESLWRIVSRIGIETDCVKDVVSQVDSNLTNITNSNLSEISSELDIIESQVNEIVGQVSTIDALAESSMSHMSDLDYLLTFTTNFIETNSLIEVTTDKACQALSELDGIDTQLMVIESKVDVADTVVSQSQLPMIDSKIDVVETKACDIDSKVDVLLGSGSMGVVSQLDVVETKACDIDSKVDVLLSSGSMGVVSQLDVVETKACDIDSKIDVVDLTVTDIKNTVDTLEIASGSNCDFIITQSQVPFTVSIPGVYCVAGSLSAGSGGVITIATDDVTIDINGNTISGTTCITLNSGIDRVVIRNGTLKPRTAVGSVGVSAAGTNTHIVIEDLNILNSVSNGILFGSGQYISIANCVISDPGSNGISFTGVNDFNIHNCQITGAADDGVSIDNCNRFEIKELTIEGCDNGIDIASASSDFMIRECTIQGSANDGIEVTDSSEDFIIRDCSVINASNRAICLGDAGVLVGSYVVDNCIIEGTTLSRGVDSQTTTAAEVIIKNTSITDVASDGFIIFGITDAGKLIMENCHVIGAGGRGFYFRNNTVGVTDTRGEVTVRNCSASSCGSDGFYAEGLLSYVCTDCVSQNNSGVGFESIDRTFAKAEFSHCKAIANTSHGFLSDDDGGSSAGSSHIVYKECSALSNGGTGFIDANTMGGTRVYIGNHSLDNGTDYSGVTQPTVALAGISASTTNKWTNISS